MNATVTEEQSPIPEGPGKRLRTLRESQDLDLSRVATLLHLSEEKLEALEADDYSRLPSSVFVQGYLRNYARFLGVPVEPILVAYHKMNPERGRLPDLKIAQVSHEVGSGHILVRLITWSIVIGLLALVLVWWRGYLQWPVQSMFGEGEPVEQRTEQSEEEGDTPVFPDTDILAEITDDGRTTLVLPQTDMAAPAGDVASQSTSEPTPAAVVDAAPESAAMAPSIPAPAAQEPESFTPVAVQTTASAAQEVTQSTTAVGGRVVLQFDGPSWTKISDASGRFKIMGEVKAGTRQVLEGSPPFDLVVGKAAVVRVYVDGREFDLSPYTRGNVARLTLDPEKIDR